MSPLTALLTGLTSGGLTCLAVQGGLLVGLLARREPDSETGPRWRQLVAPVGAFLSAKLVAHALLGLGLGLLGSRLALSPQVRIALQTLAALFMVVAGIRLLRPTWLPWLNFVPPAPLRRLVRRAGRNESLLAPALLGLLTIFIPCGTTQAMEIAAIATRSASQAAAIMGAFVLGTAPLFFVIGLLAKGTTLIQRRLAFVTAAIVIGLGLSSLNGVLVMTGSSYSFQSQRAAWAWVLSGREAQPSGDANAVADNAPTIEVRTNGYTPSSLTVAANQPVTLNLRGLGRLGCTSIFRIPTLNIEQSIHSDGTTRVALRFPRPGRYTFTCGMGMYTGTIDAV